MNSQATLNYLKQSLKMKICKKLIANICLDGLKIINTDERTITLSIALDSIDTVSAESCPEIPEEGHGPGHTVRVSIDMETIIDILIVDDIEFNLSVLKKLLENLHLNCTCENTHRKLTVHCALSGKAALELINKQNRLKGGYRLIIMDCLMPEMDGWETSIAIRSLYEMQQIAILPYIIAYSAFDSKEDIIKSRESGMCDHISKPCTQKDFCDKITRLLSRSLILN